MIEGACRHYLSRYAEKRSSPTVHAYVENQLYWFQNPKVEYIEKLLRGFSARLADSFIAKIGDEGKDAIDSVVNNKNQLAHGKGAGLGLDTMQRYHKDVVAAIDALRDVVAAAQ